MASHETPIWTDGNSWKTELPTQQEIDTEAETAPELTDEQYAEMG